MKPVDPTELSAYLDGELDVTRAKEIEVALAADPELREAFDQLQRHDATWTLAAKSAVSLPRVRFLAAVSTPSFFARLALLTLGLVAIRLLPKFFDAASFGVMLHLAVFAAVIIWLIRSDPRRDVRGQRG